MAKVRIYELAKKLNRNSKDILDELSNMGFEGKSHSSSIDESIADKIARLLGEVEVVEAPPAPKEELKPKKEIIKEPLRKEAKKEEIKPEVKEIKAEVKVASEPATTVKAEKKIEAKIETKETVKKKSEPKKPAKPHKGKTETTIKLEPTLPSEPPPLITEEAAVEQPSAPAAPEGEEDVALPDRFKKDIEAEKIEKFKAKPGLQRAFQTIRKVEPKKWHDTKTLRKGGKPSFSPKQETKQQILSTAPRKKNLKLREGASVKEFA